MEDPSLPRYWIRPYYSSFNGMRGLAVSMVFLHHYSGFWHATKLQSFTWAGVDLFFVLSGFLITGILYDSLAAPHFFRNFYVRRALRIFPIFYGAFLILFLLTPLLHLRYSGSLLTFFFYIGNLIVPFVDLARHNPTSILMLRHGAWVEVCNIGHLWSLCIEEQFYLIWPSVIWFVRDRRKLMRLCVVLCLFAILERFYLRQYHYHPMLLHWSTYTRYDTLVMGAWLALWLRGEPLSLARLRRISTLLFWIPLALVLIGMDLFSHSYSVYAVINSRFLGTFGYTLIALSCAGILLRSLDDRSLLSRFFRLRVFSALGIISYGFYFIHMLPESGLQLVAIDHPRFLPWAPFVAFAFTVTLATLSFHYFETPFLKLKRVLAPQQTLHNPEGAMVPARLHVSEPEA